MYISLIAHVNLCTSAWFSQALLLPPFLTLKPLRCHCFLPFILLLPHSRTWKNSLTTTVGILQRCCVLTQRHRNTLRFTQTQWLLKANQQRVTERNHVGSQLDSLLMLCDFSAEQRTHCRDSRLKVINPIPAITLSNIYCIPLSAVRETNEKSSTRTSHNHGTVPVPEAVRAEQVKRTFSHFSGRQGL